MHHVQKVGQRSTFLAWCIVCYIKARPRLPLSELMTRPLHQKLISKLHAHRFSNLYIQLRINHHSCFPIDFENLNHMAVTARHKHKLTIRRDGEIAGMGSCGLEAYFVSRPDFLSTSNTEMPSCIPMGCIEKATVGRQMNISTSKRTGLRSQYALQLLQCTLVISQYGYRAIQFAYKVSHIAF